METVHAIRDQGKESDTIALTFSNGNDTIRTPNVGNSTKFEKNITINPNMKEITLDGDEGILTVSVPDSSTITDRKLNVHTWSVQ